MQSDPTDFRSGTQPSGSSASGALKRETDATKSALNDASGAVRERASGLASDAKKVATEQAEAAQQTLGSYLQNFVGALNAAGEHLKKNDQSQVAGLVDSAAGSVDDLARTVKEKPLDQVVDQLRSFGRSNPTILLAGSVLAGLAAARFLKSSAPSASSTSSYPSSSSYPGSSSGTNRYSPGSSSGTGSSFGASSSSGLGAGSSTGSSSFGAGSGASGASTTSSTTSGSAYPSALSDAAGDRTARDTVESSPYKPAGATSSSSSSLPPLEGTPEVWPADYKPSGDRRND
ncbi:hypothetical protein [Tianweitania sediminis]|uniref:Uncharacterized protein n=1 Tax=Tianweitania sediminis TaxID=1502156 RepID=A0A8J7QZM8_9HYPH|nr:hypothetical protein [Tianweitania sediminis]MBP0437131.1 hypothetical protein [Tianweitania sediminis]